MITFDPINKIIQLDSFTVSERQIWTAFVNWSVLGDNLKFGVGITQIGGVAPIALYIYLMDGWKVRPVEADGEVTIQGFLLTDDNSSPVTQTVGNFNVLVKLETPLAAAAINTSESTVDIRGITSSLAALTNLATQLHRLEGLDPATPLTVTPTSRQAGDISQTITGDGVNTSTVTRNE